VYLESELEREFQKFPNINMVLEPTVAAMAMAATPARFEEEL